MQVGAHAPSINGSTSCTETLTEKLEPASGGTVTTALPDKVQVYAPFAEQDAERGKSPAAATEKWPDALAWQLAKGIPPGCPPERLSFTSIVRLWPRVTAPALSPPTTTPGRRQSGGGQGGEAETGQEESPRTAGPHRKSIADRSAMSFGAA